MRRGEIGTGVAPTGGDSVTRPCNSSTLTRQPAQSTCLAFLVCGSEGVAHVGARCQSRDGLDLAGAEDPSLTIPSWQRHKSLPAGDSGESPGYLDQIPARHSACTPISNILSPHTLSSASHDCSPASLTWNQILPKNGRHTFRLRGRHHLCADVWWWVARSRGSMVRHQPPPVQQTSTACPLPTSGRTQHTLTPQVARHRIEDTHRAAEACC